MSTHNITLQPLTSKNLTVTTKYIACRDLFIFLCNFVLNTSFSYEKLTSQVRQDTPVAMCVSVHTYMSVSGVRF